MIWSVATVLFFAAFALCSVVLAVGIVLIAMGEGKKRGVAALCLIYIASKFAYGFQMSALPAGTSSLSALIAVMLLVAAVQLPFVRFGKFFRKRGLAAGALTRIPNAAGLLTEAIAAGESLLLYALVQPMRSPCSFLPRSSGARR